MTTYYALISTKNTTLTLTNSKLIPKRILNTTEGEKRILK